MRMRFGLLGLALCGLLTGCSQLSPATLQDLGSADKIVLITFRDGETLKGRIIEDQTVTFQTFGKIYRGEIERVSDAEIVLKNAYISTEYDRYRVQRERMEKGTLRITDDQSERIVLPTYRIAKVERVSVDKAKTARYGIFWGFTASVLAAILTARL
jgi:hypothetical protein